jgi:hypothetical protein
MLKGGPKCGGRGLSWTVPARWCTLVTAPLTPTCGLATTSAMLPLCMSSVGDSTDGERLLKGAGLACRTPGGTTELGSVEW